MLINELPVWIEAKKWCQQAPLEGKLFSGSLKVDELTSLENSLKQAARSDLAFSLCFSLDELGFHRIVGEINVKFELECQRCLQNFQYHLKSNIIVSPICSESEIEKLPEQYEPLLLTDEKIKLTDWLSEELNLGLPIVPSHDNDCQIDPKYINNHKTEQKPDNNFGKKSPFAVLTELK